MEIEFDLTKSVEENAGTYFNLAKKAKKKLQGAREALEESRKKLEQLQKEESKFFHEEEKKQQSKTERKREWYEKFHWFVSSEGYLCVGGKDATSNEMVIKKHLEKGDLVFHTDMAGSPFFVVKGGQEAGEETRKEAAQTVAVFSRAWKLEHVTADVFYVLPEQVSKEAQPGEYMSKGSFMIRGKTTYIHPRLEYAVGLAEGQVIGGPISAIEKKTRNFVAVVPGREKKSSLAKRVRAKLKGGDLDEITKFLPAGGGEIKK